MTSVQGNVLQCWPTFTQIKLKSSKGDVGVCQLDIPDWRQNNVVEELQSKRHGWETDGKAGQHCGAVDEFVDIEYGYEAVDQAWELKIVVMK